MNISIIVAVANNWVIGKENKLIWHLPEDLKRFKQITMGHSILMGRKTFESIGKPLPGRTSIVISRNKNEFEGCINTTSIESAIENISQNDEIFVIGGAEIYRQTIDFANRIYLTQIHSTFDGDVYFPVIDFNKWEVIDKEENLFSEKQKLTYSFITLSRIK